MMSSLPSGVSINQADLDNFEFDESDEDYIPKADIPKKKTLFMSNLLRSQQQSPTTQQNPLSETHEDGGFDIFAANVAPKIDDHGSYDMFHSPSKEQLAAIKDQEDDKETI